MTELFMIQVMGLVTFAGLITMIVLVANRCYCK